MTDQQAPEPSADAGRQPQIQTYRGRSLSELAPQIRADHGDGAVILRQREGVTGGFGGFFAKRCVEVDVLVPDELASVASSASGGARGGHIDVTDGPVATPSGSERPADDAPAVVEPVAAEGAGTSSMLDELDAVFSAPAPEGYVSAFKPLSGELGELGGEDAASEPQPTPAASESAEHPAPVVQPESKNEPAAPSTPAAPAADDSRAPLVTSMGGAAPAFPPSAPAVVPTPPAFTAPAVAAPRVPPTPAAEPPAAVPAAAAPTAPVSAPAPEVVDVVAQQPVGPSPEEVEADAAQSFRQRLREIQEERDLFDQRMREQSESPAEAPAQAAEVLAAELPTPAAARPERSPAERDARQLDKTYRRLVDAGLPESVTAAVIDDALTHRRTLEPGLGVRKAIVDELAARIATRPLRGRRGTAVAFVGPPGTGKTRAIARLAAAYTAGGHVPVACVSVGGSSDDGVLLHALAPFGVPMHAVSSPKQAAERVATLKAAGYIVFVDTPGVPPVDPEAISGLAALLSPVELDRVLLCVPISHGASVVARVLQTLAPLKADSLLLTRADEAASPGGAIAAALDAELPLAYVSGGTGRGAIVPAVARRLSRMMLTGEPLQATEVAVPDAPFMPVPAARPAAGGTRFDADVRAPRGANADGGR